MDIYSENFFDHYKNPRNKGRLNQATNHATEINSSCGDEISVQIINDKYKIRNVKYDVSGCMVTTATASILSEELVGKKVVDVLKMSIKELKDIIKVDLTPSRTRCALIVLLAIQKALKNEKD